MAAAGIRKKSGLRKSATKNKIAVTTLAKPVRAPAATPEEDSTNEVTVEVPKQAPATVPIASESRAGFTCGSFPSSSRRPALSATPIRVPTVSNISAYRKVNMMTKNLSRFWLIQWKSNEKK